MFLCSLGEHNAQAQTIATVPVTTTRVFPKGRGKGVVGTGERHHVTALTPLEEPPKNAKTQHGAHTGSRTQHVNMCPSRKKALGIRAAFERPDTPKVCRPGKKGARGRAEKEEAPIPLEEKIGASQESPAARIPQASEIVKDTK
jgi:hypothetical protein